MVNPRSIGIEREFITDDVHELAALKARLIANGVSVGKAAGLAGWLIDKAAGLPDLSTPNARADYRKLLAALVDEPQPGSPRRRPARRPKGGQRLTAHNARSRRYVSSAMRAFSDRIAA